MADLNEHKPLPVASPFIRAALQDLDPNLHLNFDPRTWLWGVWWRNPEGVLEHVLNVVSSEGGYEELDYRVIDEIKKARYFAEHPELVQKHIVDDFIEGIQKAEEREHEQVRHMANDASLRKVFDQAVEKMKSIPMAEWKRRRYMKNRDGSIARTVDGNPVEWVPHKSLLK